VVGSESSKSYGYIIKGVENPEDSSKHKCLKVIAFEKMK